MHYSNNGDSLNNIISSFRDEAADHVRYSILKDDARNGGNMDLAALYEELANEEFNHAKIWYKEAFKDKENEELAKSIANETQASAFSYTEKAKKAELEGYEDLADRFLANGKAEAMHRDKLISYRDEMNDGNRYHSHEDTVWICTVCGYTHTGTKPPKECPLCGYGENAFRRA